MPSDDPLDRAFTRPDEVTAYVTGVYTGLKRPHRYPPTPDRWTAETAYFKGGVLTAKAIMAVTVVVVAYTRIVGF